MENTNSLTNNILIPTELVRCNDLNIYNISDKIFVLYILIYINMNVYKTSIISINEILQYCGIKSSSKRKDTNSYKKIINCFEFLKCNNIIETETDFNKVKFNEAIYIKINDETLSKYKGKLSAITPYQFKKILKICEENHVDVCNMLHSFLFLSSYIGYDINNKKSNHSFYGVLEHASSTIGISYIVFLKYIKLLSDPDNGVLKKVHAYGYNNDRKVVNLPNIYVLSNKYADIEIGKAAKELEKKYNCKVTIKEN